MKTITEILIDHFYHAFQKAFPSLSLDRNAVEISQTAQAQFGHYQCNSAMKFSKVLRLAPWQVSEKIVQQLQEMAEVKELVSNLEIAGPGFINITLHTSFINQYVEFMLNDSHLGLDLPEKKQKIIIDFSSPNIAKEMHVGHLRSTIIGDCLARVFEFLGHDVLRLNHIGDWGTSFGMLIAYIKENAPSLLTEEKTTDLSQLVKWYKEAKVKFDADPLFKRMSQLEVVSLQSGEKSAIKAWEIICEISRKAYQEIYDLLQVRLIERGESFYNPMLAQIVADLESKGLITLSDGAKCIFLEGFKNREGNILPLMVQKSDGGYNYDTTDMAAIKHRIEDEKADRLIYITDAGQITHFQMVFQAAEKAGYLNPTKVKVDHVAFGLVLGTDGKKFRTRSGETEKLIDLLNTAIEKASQILDERNPNMDPQDKKELAHALGIGAIKYADLSCNRTGDYTFSYDRMLKFEGNTAAFLMYSYVRVAGIKRKVQQDIEEIKKNAHIHLEHPSEIALGIHLAQFGEVLDQTTRDLLPNRLADYLYGLAEKFNAFFRDCRVEGSPEQNSRLLLCETVARVIKQGLELLGIQTVERM